MNNRQCSASGSCSIADDLRRSYDDSMRGLVVVTVR